MHCSFKAHHTSLAKPFLPSVHNVIKGGSLPLFYGPPSIILWTLIPTDLYYGLVYSDLPCWRFDSNLTTTCTSDWVDYEWHQELTLVGIELISSFLCLGSFSRICNYLKFVFITTVLNDCWTHFQTNYSCKLTKFTAVHACPLAMYHRCFTSVGLPIVCDVDEHNSQNLMLTLDTLALKIFNAMLIPYLHNIYI